MTTQTAAELHTEIDGHVAYARELMAQIGSQLAEGRFAAASIQTDYLMAQIKSAERMQKRLAKLAPQAPAPRPSEQRPAPVTDHVAEGDGSEYPTWCSCGRSFSEHLRRPV
jgi:hypothetical protein